LICTGFYFSFFPTFGWTQEINPYSQGNPHPARSPKTHQSEELPLYVNTRFTVVIPEKATTDAVALGLGFGLADQAGHFLGLRLIWIPEPPQDFLDSSNSLQSAWGPVIEWNTLFSENGRLSFFSNIAGGFVYGLRKEKASTLLIEQQNPNQDQDLNKEHNLILPVLELGFGLRISSKKVGESRFFIAPELGYIFTGRSPYASVSIGIY
jgi:hypothetical protein